MKIKKKFPKLMSALLAVVMMISALPMSAFAAAASDLPANMTDHSILRALEYTGYDVQQQIKDGTLYQSGSYGSRTPSSVLSNISYGTSTSGKETVADSSTPTGKAPDIARYEQYGLCCASFVTYYVCNYLPNIEGADTQFITDAINATGWNSQAVVTWQKALNGLVDEGKIEKIGTSASNVNRSKLTPGDLIIFGDSENSHKHIAVYSGTYNGVDFIIHVGNDRGREISRVDWMGQAGDKSSYPNAYYHLPQEIFESDGEIEVYKKDTDGKNLSGAVFVATNTESGKSYKIGPTNSSGYAKTENLQGGTQMKKIYRRSISGLMALLICFTTILGGGITAFAASSSGEVAKSYSIGFPRSGDANLDYSGTWGHDELHYMNGWTSGEATWMTTLHTIGSFDGPACYCIEPGVPRLLEKTYTRYGEDYWENYPSDYNSTIDADTIKTLLGRIMQYGYQGDLSLDWRSQNEADADKMAHMMATQVLVWETVVGERDANFNHVDPGSADAVKSVYRTSHPLYSRFSAYYDSIEASVQSHTVIPSFMSKTPNKAQTVELKWDGGQYTATLTDSNHVVSNYTFSSNLSDIVFTSNGDTLTITAKTAPAEPVTISAIKNNIRKGVVVWSDGHYGPDGTMQDAVTYAATVMDPVQAFLNLKVSYGSAKIVKTSEDGKVDNLTFTVTGNGINQTVKTNSKGEIQIDNLMPGVYTVSEMDYDKYEPQESRRVTVVSGQVSTVTFNNKLKRGDLQIVKSSEDNLNEGVTFHLYGTSLSGIAVDEYVPPAAQAAIKEQQN